MYNKDLKKCNVAGCMNKPKNNGWSTSIGNLIIELNNSWSTLTGR